MFAHKDKSKMQKIEPIVSGGFYHIYNRGINSCDLFTEPANYEYFLKLYDKYISSVAETYAWVLMKNHFHLLVRIKEEPDTVSLLSNSDRVLNPVRVTESPNHVRVDEACSSSKQFSKLFNSYAQAFNKRNHRHGGLFERPFKRKLITNESYLRQVIQYIHNNPVHHGFCEHPNEYPWSSYQTCISQKPTKLKREIVIGWYDDVVNFTFCHNQKLEVEKIEEWLEI
jgi:REP element-mobilizing transposase RayT